MGKPHPLYGRWNKMGSPRDKGEPGSLDTLWLASPPPCGAEPAGPPGVCSTSWPTWGLLHELAQGLASGKCLEQLLN